jgi:lysyl-tRNA synthetase class 2
LEKAESTVASDMREHLSSLREHGVDPYPRTFDRTHSSAQISESFDALEGTEVTVAGRLMAIRGHGKAGFADLSDSAGRLQIYVRKDEIGEDAAELWKLVDVGDIVGVRGEVMRTRTGEVSVKAREITVLAKSLLPLPEKWHGLKDQEQRYRQRYLDIIANPDSREVFRKRSRILSVAREFLEERNFIEVETPVLQSTYGGAFARPFVTHHHSLGIDLYLRIADELYLKRLIVGGLERVFEIGKDFRNEGMDRTHSPEFTQLELYQAYADYNDMMALTEELIARMADDVCGGRVINWQGSELDLNPPWRRLHVADAVREAVGVDAGAALDELKAAAAAKGVELPDPLTRGRLVEEILDSLVEPGLVEPTFLVDYPKEISPLAKSTPDDPDTVERFEVFIGGLELGNSFSELNDPDEQRSRFEFQVEQREGGDAEAHGMDEDFVRALEHGMPPTGGLGIGLDRLVMLLTNQKNIRDVILFPSMRPES